MSESVQSQAWYRVAHLKPRLRPNADLHRHVYRGEVWHVLQDHASGRFHRFSPEAYFVISLMNGRRTLDEIWTAAGEPLGEDLPTQDETMRLLSQLHGADAVQVDIPADVEEIVDQADRRRRRELLQKVRNPLALRAPLFDPDRFLDATMPFVRPLFSWFGAALWLAVVGFGGLLAWRHWPELTENVVDRVIAADNLLLLALSYPPVKALHELGHGYAVKRWGGEVHDIGVMFLVFFPVPYVDATAATAFGDKWRRVLVGAAGILVEVFIAAVAMMLWAGMEPGIERSYLFNVMLIAGVSTVLFNGNPLLRFDGYYVLADAIEIPNLGTRSNQYLQYLARRYLFGVEAVRSPAASRGERRWFVLYGIAAAIYRIFIMLAIAIFVATQFFVIGVILAIWAVSLTVLAPLAKGLAYLFSSPELDQRRGRAMGVVAGAGALLAAGIFVVPAPFFTNVEGVVWVPEEALVRAGADGFVADVLATPNAQTTAGAPLLRLEDPLLGARARTLEARANELARQYETLFVRDRAGAEVARERLDQARAELAAAREKADQLVVRAHAAGQFILPNPTGLLGRYVRKGESLGYVVGEHDRIVRAIVRQSDIDLVRNRAEAVELRFVDRLSEVVPGAIAREVPAATDELPSPALGARGGGEIYLDPRSSTRAPRAIEALFQVDVRPAAAAPDGRIGGRVRVRFDHGDEPIGLRLYRRIRRLVLDRFDA